MSPVCLAQFAELFSSHAYSTGAPLDPVTVAPPMVLLIARAATRRQRPSGLLYQQVFHPCEHENMRTIERPYRGPAVALELTRPRVVATSC